MGSKCTLGAVIVLLLFCVSAQASTLDSLVKIRRSVYYKLYHQDSVDNLPIALVNEQINESIHHIATENPWVVKYDTVTLSNGTFSYALNTDFSRLAWAIQMETKQGENITTPIPFQILKAEVVFEQLQVFSRSVPPSPDAPATHAWAQNKTIYIFPPPQATDSLVICYYGEGTVLAADGDTTDILLGKRDAIVFHAVSILSHTLSRPTEATSYMSEYERMRQKEVNVQTNR